MKAKNRLPSILVLLSTCIILIFILLPDDIVDTRLESVIEPTYSIPRSTDNVYIGNPVGLSVSSDRIFVSDQKASSILVFDLDGNFVKSIGNQGSGPGELFMPGMIRYSNGHIYINDIGNGRIVTHNLLQDTNDYKFPDRIPRKIVVADKLICMTKLLGNESVSAELKLITCYDLNLNHVTSFGTYLNIVEGMPAGASEVYLEIFKDHLFVLFRYYPLLRVYDFNGNIVEEFDFSERYSRLIPENFNNKAFSNPSIVNLTSLFSGFDVTEDGIFLHVYNSKELASDYFNFDGQFQQRIRQNIEMDTYYVRDTEMVRNENGSIGFYLLGIANNIPRIDFFELNLDL